MTVTVKLKNSWWDRKVRIFILWIPDVSEIIGPLTYLAILEVGRVDTDMRPAASMDTDKSVECQYPQWKNCKVHFVYIMNPKLRKITMCNASMSP